MKPEHRDKLQSYGVVHKTNHGGPSWDGGFRKTEQEKEAIEKAED